VRRPCVSTTLYKFSFANQLLYDFFHSLNQRAEISEPQNTDVLNSKYPEDPLQHFYSEALRLGAPYSIGFRQSWRTERAVSNHSLLLEETCASQDRFATQETIEPFPCGIQKHWASRCRSTKNVDSFGESVSTTLEVGGSSAKALTKNGSSFSGSIRRFLGVV
jgi:hypothetical protein